MNTSRSLKLLAILLGLAAGGPLYAQCPASITLTAALTGVTVTEHASQTLSASNAVNSGNVTYKAGQAVILTTGFVAKSGSVFLAAISPCSVPPPALPAPDSRELAITAYPNPFATNTLIEYSLPQKVRVTLVVYSEKGVEVARILTNEEQPEGRHRVTFESHGLAQGIYLCALSTPEGRKVYKMIKQQ